MISKVCTKCNIRKSIELFPKRKESLDGYRNECKECRKQYNIHLRLKNPDKYIESDAIYYSKNKEKINNRSNEWYKNNKDRKLSVAKKWRENNKEKVIEISKRWVENNRDRVRENARKYRETDKWKAIDANKSHRRRIQKKVTCDGSVTTESLLQLMVTQENKCYHCENMLDMDTPYMVHLDHLIPLSKCGEHILSNVVWSCQRCNLVKGNK